MKELMAKKRCKCKMCTRHRMIREATDRANVHTLKRIIDDLENSLVETEEELSYYSSIFNGTWPGAVEVLENLLKVLKRKKHDKGKTT